VWTPQITKKLNARFNKERGEERGKKKII
jgi:hypothetical protein